MLSPKNSTFKRSGRGVGTMLPPATVKPRNTVLDTSGGVQRASFSFMPRANSVTLCSATGKPDASSSVPLIAFSTTAPSSTLMDTVGGSFAELPLVSNLASMPEPMKLTVMWLPLFTVTALPACVRSQRP